MKTLFCLILLLGIHSSLEARTWTSSTGIALEAEYLSATASEVTLKRTKDGKIFTIPLARLSEADQSPQMAL